MVTRKDFADWDFETFKKTGQGLRKDITIVGETAKSGDITVRVRKLSRQLGTGLSIQYGADNVTVADLPDTDMALYEFTGLHTVGWGDGTPGEMRNISIVGKKGLEGDLASSVGDSVQWTTLQGEILLPDSVSSAESVESIRSSKEYKQAVSILAMLYKEVADYSFED